MRYEVLEKSYINTQLVEPGAIIEWTPPPGGKAGKNLKPLDEVVAKKKGGGESSDVDDLV